MIHVTRDDELRLVYINQWYPRYTATIDCVNVVPKTASVININSYFRNWSGYCFGELFWNTKLNDGNYAVKATLGQALGWQEGDHDIEMPLQGYDDSERKVYLQMYWTQRLHFFGHVTGWTDGFCL